MLTQILDTAGTFLERQRPRGQEGAAAARQERVQPVLREQHPHPHHLRDRRQAPVGRRHQPGHRAIVSTAKGESLLDTIANLSAMHADMFVVRHSRERRALPDRPARARRMCTWSTPATAATRTRRRGCWTCTPSATSRRTSRSLTVAIVGDIVHSRVARSDIHALTTLGVPEIRAVGPKTLVPGDLARDGRARVPRHGRGHPRRRRDHHAAAAERTHERRACCPAPASSSRATA